jgi:hypothetical protein
VQPGKEDGDEKYACQATPGAGQGGVRVVGEGLSYEVRGGVRAGVERRGRIDKDDGGCQEGNAYETAQGADPGDKQRASYCWKWGTIVSLASDMSRSGVVP